MQNTIDACDNSPIPVYFIDGNHLTTPTWHDVLPAMLTVLENPKASQKSRTMMFEELERMAALADKYNTIAPGMK